MLRFISIAIVLFVFPVHAQGLVCADRGKVVDYLADKHKERPVAIGLANNGGVLEVLSAKSGSWSIVITMPAGPTCFVASGENWERLPAREVKKGEGS